jgi:hypothetical protein
MTKLIPPTLNTVLLGTAADVGLRKDSPLAPVGLKIGVGELPIKMGIGCVRLILVFLATRGMREVPVLV